MKILLMLFLSLGTYYLPISVAESDHALESISEVDLTFFMTHPKMPWGTDPFHKHPGFANVPKKADSEFSLGAIIYSKNVPMAIINGKTVKEGDRILDRSVSSIGDNFVILKKKDSELELTLPPLTEENEEWVDESGEE